MFAAIEAGGTKFVCGVGDAGGSRERITIPTADVASTMAQVGAFLDRAIDAHRPLQAIGIGSFGPLDLDTSSPGYGRITTTPKPGWSDADMPAYLRDRYGVPVAIDTDVNAAAVAEARASGVRTLAYVTVGTGIGVGLAIDGRSHVGLGHSEAGHIPVRRHPSHRGFAGTCPYHADCLEGLAAGPAVAAAWGTTLGHLPHSHPAWQIEADYIGQLCATLILTVAPDRIVLGGGVMQQARLLPMVRLATLSILGGYSAHWNADRAASAIVAPQSTEPPGLVGAYLLAQAAI